VDAYLLDNGPDTEVALAYGHPIGTWDVSLITDFSELFDAVIRNAMAADFDEDISTWNTGRATTMFAMFDGARAFNQNMSGWNVARVVDMDFMFSGCASFESDLSGWNTGSVQLAAFMFADAVRFVSPPQAIPAIAATDFLPYSFSHLLRRTVIYPGQPAP
jgi:surface protein